MLKTLLAVAFSCLAVLVLVATFLPLWRSNLWWVRGWEFARAQWLVLGVIGLALFTLRWAGGMPRFRFEAWLALALLVASIFQVWRILPYTPLASPQSLAAEPDAGNRLSLLVANVLMDNRDSERLIELVRAKRPDFFFAAETDEWWARQLSVLEDDFSHSVQKPLDNTYGFVLYSEHELIEPEIRYLMDPEIPSLRTRVRLENGTVVRMFFLHPKPPSPTESRTSTKRDAEILVVGREIGEHNWPAIVAGDLNDVAWSYTTRLFQRVSGTLDPRIGRGLYSTFHAGIPVLRWPLDHVFHTEHFKLISLERGPAIGSDHFPIYVELSLEKDGPLQQEAPKAEADDFEEADEKVVEGATEPPEEAEPPLDDDEEDEETGEEGEDEGEGEEAEDEDGSGD